MGPPEMEAVRLRPLNHVRHRHPVVLTPPLRHKRVPAPDRKQPRCDRHEQRRDIGDPAHHQNLRRLGNPNHPQQQQQRHALTASLCQV